MYTRTCVPLTTLRHSVLVITMLFIRNHPTHFYARHFDIICLLKNEEREIIITFTDYWIMLFSKYKISVFYNALFHKGFSLITNLIFGVSVLTFYIFGFFLISISRPLSISSNIANFIIALSLITE